MSVAKENRDSAATETPANDNRKYYAKADSGSEHQKQLCRCEVDRNLKESSDSYSRVLLQVSDDWRIIECRNRIQWILQRSERRSRGVEWRGRGYFRTKKALIRVCGTSILGIDTGTWDFLERLPDRFPEDREIGGAR